MTAKCLAVFGTRLLYPSWPSPSALEQVSTKSKVTVLVPPYLVLKRLPVLILVLSLLLALFALLAVLIQTIRGLHFLTDLYGSSTSCNRVISSQPTTQPKPGPLEDQADRDHHEYLADETHPTKGSL